jgi:hypothetical protein
LNQSGIIVRLTSCSGQQRGYCICFITTPVVDEYQQSIWVQSGVICAVRSTCKALYHLITQDPNSLLWRAAWSLVARDEKQVPATPGNLRQLAATPSMLACCGMYAVDLCWSIHLHGKCR